MKFKREIKIIRKYLRLLTAAARDSSTNIEVVLIGKYIMILKKAKNLFKNLKLKKENREQLSEGLLLVLREIDDQRILKNTKKVAI